MTMQTTSGPPIRVVAGVQLDDDRVLGFRRAAHKSLAGYWEFPGGKVEAGETEQSALARELREELGEEVLVGDLINRHIAPAGALLIELACYRVAFRARPDSSTDHDAIEWHRLSEIELGDWAPADRATLELLRAQRETR